MTKEKFIDGIVKLFFLIITVLAAFYFNSKVSQAEHDALKSRVITLETVVKEIKMHAENNKKVSCKIAIYMKIEGAELATICAGD